MMGPFGSEREARMAALDTAGGWQPPDLAAGNRQMLSQACAAARVETGPYDQRILNWLANYEPAMCAVVAGLITRAHAAPPADDRLARVAAVLAAFDWEHDDRQYALEVIERIILTGGGPATAPATVTLSAAQLPTVLDALADAETYREREGSARCSGCGQAPDDLCSEHSADFDAVQAYRDLTAELTGGAQ